MRFKRAGWIGWAPIVFGVTRFGLGATTAENTLRSTNNWSGYYASAPSGNTFTDITSDWVVPNVQPSISGTTYSSDWIGFDGVSDGSVEQCGVTEIITSQGSASYFAWYEFYPASEEEIPSLPVHAGDTMNAEVTYEAAESTNGNYAYYFDLTDETTGAFYANTLFTSSNDARSSAEWIAEAPSINGQPLTLANFGSITFSNDAAALGAAGDEPLGTLNDTEVEMVQSGKVVALPTSIKSNGTAFTINYGAGPANLTWNNSGGVNPSDGITWDIGTNNNWNNGKAAVAYTEGSTVTFNDSNNGHYAVTLNTIVAPGSVTVNNSAGNYTISGSGGITGIASLSKMGTGTLTLSTVNTYTGGTNLSDGILVIGVTNALPNSGVSINGGTLQLGTGTGLAQVTSLSITGNGILDVNNNHIIINYSSGTDPISAIAGYLASGYNGGAWNGVGIDSSAAAANFGYALGYADGADGVVAGLSTGQIEIAYTIQGDANLDGIVDGDDFTIVTSNLGKAVAGWDKGDFNYDGFVGGDDFTTLVNNLGKLANGAELRLPDADYAAVDAYAAANGLMTDLPEAGFSALLPIAGLAFMARRNRGGHYRWNLGTSSPRSECFCKRPIGLLVG
jgi:autotransporter-associated beta strand protein